MRYQEVKQQHLVGGDRTLNKVWRHPTRLPAALYRAQLSSSHRSPRPIRGQLIPTNHRAAYCDAQGCHYVPSAGALERSPPSCPPRHAYGFQTGPTGVRGRSRLWRTSAYPRRTSDSFAHHQGPIGAHYPAPTPPRATAAGSGGAPRVPGRFRTQGSGGLYPRLPPSGRSSLPPGPALPRPLQGPVPHKEDDAHRLERSTGHSVN
jgi:hypothetical protein